MKVQTTVLLEYQQFVMLKEYDEVVDDAFEGDHEQNIDRAQSALF